MKGEFIGFTYNGIHSHELGVIRTSSGDRFEITATPEFKDKTVSIPGTDKTVYFGTEIISSKLSLKIALEGITEEQMSHIKQKWLDKKIHPLIFDESPYKAYYARVSNSSIKFTCLEEKIGQRTYYGTGSLDFVCDYPYAIGLYKTIEEFEVDENKACDCQIEAKELPHEKAEDGSINVGWYDQQTYYFFNTGDSVADFKILFSDKTISEVQVESDFGFSFEAVLNWKVTDTYIQYDSKLQGLMGLDEQKKLTGTFYPFKNAKFAKMPIGKGKMAFKKQQSADSDVEIEYNYIYY